MTKVIKRPEFLFALVFAAFISVGRMIDTEGRLIGVTGSALLWFVVSLLGAFFGMILAEKLFDKVDGSRFKETKVNTLLVFLFFIAAYGIVLHEVYPGFFVYDAQTELLQYIRGTHDTWHPLFHTVLTGRIITFFYGFNENYNEGIFGYFLFQMIIMSAGFTYFIKELARYRIPRLFRVLSMLFLGLFPTVVMYVLCSVTDSFFAFFVFMLTVQLVALFCTPDIFDKERYRFFLIFVFTLMIMLFRKNGIYDAVVFVPFLALAYKGRYKGKLIKLIVLSVATYLIVNSAMVHVLNAEKRGQQEAFAVPIQQIGRTYNYYPEDFDEEDIEYLSSLQPIENWSLYEDKIADNLKEAIDGKVIVGDMGAFVKFYLRHFIRHPVTYLEAWLLTSYEEWYPGAVFDCYNGSGQYEEVSYFGWVTEEPGWRNLATTWGDKIYRAISVRMWPHRIPIIGLMFTPGFWLWIIIAGCVYVNRINKGFVLAFSFIFIVFLTMLLGPTSLVRYVVFVFFAVPLMLCGMFFKSRFKENQ